MSRKLTWAELGLPDTCPTCGSKEANTYYGSCWDNIHSSVFDPQRPLDPWHAYVREIIHLQKSVEALELYNSVQTEFLQLEERVNAAWGSDQFDWTIGRCPDGWFYYCGGTGIWKHGGVEPTLLKAMERMVTLGTPKD